MSVCHFIDDVFFIAAFTTNTILKQKFKSQSQDTQTYKKFSLIKKTLFLSED